MDFLNDMALFVEVVKARSFRGAAEALGMPNSTLSRRISLLEKGIGLRLLNRTTRRIDVTEAGKVYFERCKRIVAEARLAHEQLGDMLAEPSGSLRVSLPVDFAITYLAPLIAEFAQQYPAIDFEFDLTSRRVDLVSDPVDLAIRIGESEPSHMIARPLARIAGHLYASPTYLERHGEPTAPSDLGRHQCLGMMKTTVWTLHNGLERMEIPIAGRFQLNSGGMIRRLATLGMGIALLPEAIVADDIAGGRLRRIMPRWESSPVTVYAVTETRLLPARTQRFIEFLRDRLGRA